MPNLKRDSRIKSEHLSSESIEILRLLNNYSVQIAPQHSPHDDTDELVWRSEWPFFIEGHGVNNLLRIT